MADNFFQRRADFQLDRMTYGKFISPTTGKYAADGPARILFEALFLKNDVMPPRKIIESGSLGATWGPLPDINYLTLIHPSQVHYDLDFGILAALRANGLGDTERSICVTARCDASVSLGEGELIRRLHMVSRELKRPTAAPAAVKHAV